MRILVISNLYPPVARGGYEVECSGVVERLRERHEVLVLCSDLEAAGVGAQLQLSAGAQPHGRAGGPQSWVRRELRFLHDNWRGAVRAPAAALGAVRAAHATLDWKPDLLYAWNLSSIPQATLRVHADRGTPIAFRACSHALSGLFCSDQFMRELTPAARAPARRVWSVGCRALNRLPSLRLNPAAPLRMAISWNSQFIRSAVQLPSFVEPALERIGHSVPRHGELYERGVRDPSPEPQIAYLGRVTPFKGIDVAIRALALVRDEHEIPARLAVVGPQDGDYGAQMRELARELGVGSAIDWRGQLSSEQAAHELAHAHALIVPSVWQEPFPLVTIEGAFARVPLVASDTGGIGEGMHDEQHALLFPAGDHRAAADTLARTLREREQTNARVVRAFERAQSLFRLGPYLDAQEQFVHDAVQALSRA